MNAQTVASTTHVLRCPMCWFQLTVNAYAAAPEHLPCPICDGELIAVQLDPDDARPTVAQLRLNLDGQATMFDPEEATA